MVKRRTLMTGSIAAMALSGNASASTPEAVDFPYFGGIAKLDTVPDGWGAGVKRVRMQPGQVWDFVYPGPVSVYVDSGTMTVSKMMDGYFMMGDNQPSDSHGEFHGTLSEQIVPGSGVFVRDGHLGPLTNEGDTELVLFILSAVPPQDHYSEESSESATPVGP